MNESPVMKARTYLRRIFPSAFTALFLVIPPLIFSAYYFATRYSDKLLTEQPSGLGDVTNNFLSTFILTRSWVAWFNEALDFILWGAVAAIVLVTIWAIGAARVAVDNHNAQTRFKHFRVHQSTWHSQFIIVALIKVLLLVIVVFSFGLLISQAIPQLGDAVEAAIHSYSLGEIEQVLLAGLAFYVLEYVIATAINLFSHLRTDG